MAARKKAATARKPRRKRIRSTFTLSPEGLDLLADIAEYDGIPPSRVIDRLVRAEARRLGLLEDPRELAAHRRRRILRSMPDDEDL
jgi:hypothetical protein